jgi:hypothetical protein
MREAANRSFAKSHLRFRPTVKLIEVRPGCLRVNSCVVFRLHDPFDGRRLSAFGRIATSRRCLAYRMVGGFVIVVEHHRVRRSVPGAPSHNLEPNRI